MTFLNLGTEKNIGCPCIKVMGIGTGPPKIELILSDTLKGVEYDHSRGTCVYEKEISVKASLEQRSLPFSYGPGTKVFLQHSSLSDIAFSPQHFVSYGPTNRRSRMTLDQNGVLFLSKLDTFQSILSPNVAHAL